MNSILVKSKPLNSLDGMNPFNPHMLKVILVTFVLLGGGKTTPQGYLSF